MAHTSKLKGLMKRLEMIKEREPHLKPMSVVPNSTIERLGYIPRSNEKEEVDALEMVKKYGTDLTGHPNAVIIFYSHRWKRPNWCQKFGKDLEYDSAEREALRIADPKLRIGEVDDDEDSKAKALIEYAKWFKRQCSDILGAANRVGDALSDITNEPEIFWWIDFACADQDDTEKTATAMATLPAYVAVSTCLVAAWFDGYDGRAWCQLELLMSYAFSTAGQYVFVLPKGFKDGATKKLDCYSYPVTILDPKDTSTANLTNKKDVNVTVEVYAFLGTKSKQLLACKDCCWIASIQSNDDDLRSSTCVETKFTTQSGEIVRGNTEGFLAELQKAAQTNWIWQ